MTREEAIRRMECCRNFLANNYSDMGEPNFTAFNMAIKALEQEPCEDAISRQAVLDGIDVKAWEFCDYLISKGRNDEQKPVSHFTDNLREYIRDELPSVNPQEPKTWHWKPYLKEGLRYQCSACDSRFDTPWEYCPHCGAKMAESEDKE